MKRLFTQHKAFNILVLLILLAQAAKAQGNLKFSQVRYVVLTGVGNYSLSGAAETQVIATQNIVVAANHVLKIENITGLQLDGLLSKGGTTAYYASLLLDEATISRSGIFNTPPNQSFPLWLPAGVYVLKLIFYNGQYQCYSCGSALSVPIKTGISALDFEVVP